MGGYVVFSNPKTLKDTPQNEQILKKEEDSKTKDISYMELFKDEQCQVILKSSGTVLRLCDVARCLQFFQSEPITFLLNLFYFTMKLT